MQFDREATRFSGPPPCFLSVLPFSAGFSLAESHPGEAHADVYQTPAFVTETGYHRRAPHLTDLAAKYRKNAEL